MNTSRSTVRAGAPSPAGDRRGDLDRGIAERTMCLQPGDEIGRTMHPNVDQFFRIEQGEATFLLSGKEHMVREGDAVVVPAGTFHSVLNTSQMTPLRLYTIYSPPNHPDGTVHRTKLDAEAADAAHRSSLQQSR